MKEINHTKRSNAPPKLRLLLKLRDGPRGRDPAFGLNLFLLSNGESIAQIINHSVNACLIPGKIGNTAGRLCAFSAHSEKVVDNNKKTENRKSTGLYRAILNILKTFTCETDRNYLHHTFRREMTFRLHCILKEDWRRKCHYWKDELRIGMRDSALIISGLRMNIDK